MDGLTARFDDEPMIITARAASALRDDPTAHGPLRVQLIPHRSPGLGAEPAPRAGEPIVVEVVDSAPTRQRDDHVIACAGVELVVSARLLRCLGPSTLDLAGEGLDPRRLVLRHPRAADLERGEEVTATG